MQAEMPAQTFCQGSRGQIQQKRGFFLCESQKNQKQKKNSQKRQKSIYKHKKIWYNNINLSSFRKQWSKTEEKEFQYRRIFSMKRMIAGLLTVILLLCAFPVAVSAEAATVSEPTPWYDLAADSFDGGTGTSTDPYQIATPEQLAYLAKVFNEKSITDYRGQKYYYQLTADIYLNDVTADQSTWKQWTPIKGFDGTLDGNGKAIVGLYISSEEENAKKGDEEKGQYGGLFGNHHFNHDAASTTRHPTIKNLAIMDSVIYMPNSMYVSVLGWGEAIIDSCYVECDMTVSSNSGIVQAWSGGTVTNTVAAGTLTVTNLGNRAGAFASGYNADSTTAYTNCISVVKTNAVNFGFIGQVDKAISKKQFDNCYMLQPNSENPIGSFAYTLKAPNTGVTLGGELVEDYATLLSETANFKNLTGSVWISDGTYLPLLKAFENSPFADDMRMKNQADLYPVEMEMLGASIRCGAPTTEYPDGTYGLRVATEVEFNAFTSAYEITEADFTSLNSFYENHKDQIYFGTLFLPLDRLGETEQLTFACADIVDVKAEKTELKDGKIFYTSVMTDFPQDAQNRAMVARSYVAFRADLNSDKWTVVYNKESIIRTYMGVAALAYENAAEESDTFLGQLEQEFGASALQNYGVKLNGASLAKYQIVISDTADFNLLQTAAKLQRQLIEICGTALPIVSDTASATGQELWLGESDRTAALNTSLPGLNTALYGVVENNLYLVSPHYYALYCAVEDLCSALPSNATATFGATLTNVTDVDLTWAKDSAYTLVWNDEFTGTVMDTEKWTLKENVDLSSHGVYNSTDSDVCYMDKNGNLVIAAVYRQDGTYETPYSITTSDTMNFSGGYLEMQAKVPFKGNGEWPGFWSTGGADSVLFNKCYTVPDTIPSRQPGATTAKDVNGYGIEIDFFEVFSSTTELKCNIHRWYSDYVTVNYKVTPDSSVHLDTFAAGYGNSSGATGQKSYTFSSSTVANDYHTYGFLWTSEQMQFLVDGVVYYTYNLTNHSDSVFNQTLTKRTAKNESNESLKWLNTKYWNDDAKNLTLDLEGFKPENIALNVILGMHVFTESYTANATWYKGNEVKDNDQFPINYTVDYVRLYQTSGDVLYLPAEYGNGIEMYQTRTNLQATKIVQP